MGEALSGLRFAHAELPPHDADRPTVTGPFQVGVAFSAHRDVCFRTGGRRREATYAGGSVICSAEEEIVWERVREPTEALEMYLDPALFMRLSDGTMTWPISEALVGRADPVVVAGAAVLRRAHVTGAELEAVAVSLSNVSHFRRQFTADTGCTPGRYRHLSRRTD